MKIAIIGSRGIPAQWGGYETASEEIAIGLAQYGHEVTVFCRPRYSSPDRPASYRGVNLVYVPCLDGKSLETLSHEIASMVAAIVRGFDLVYVLGMRSSFIYPAYRLLRPRSKLVMNPDGLDWRRRKWGRFGRAYLKAAEAFGTRWVSHRVVADSAAIQSYLDATYGVKATFIPYGSRLRYSEAPELLERFGLKPREYFLVVARLEPENNTDVIVKAFKGLETSKRLVVVGGTNYRSEFEERLRATGDSRIIFTGPLYDRPLVRELYTNCYAYIHGHEVGGTNPALLDAMASGCAVFALDVVFNREVLGECGAFWARDPLSLRRLMAAAPGLPLDEWREAARRRIASNYDWDKIVQAYHALFGSLS